MPESDLHPWRHDHAFGLDSPSVAERRTRWVIALTVVVMLVEIVAGHLFASMALLADGWHMASHAAALTVTAFAYWFARRHARSEEFSFGTGKVGVLGGFASAVALALVALLVFFESTQRILAPVEIHFDQAIGVASLGLVVNIVSALLLKEDHSHDEGPGAHSHHHDHNLKAAYLHVLADAMTSVFALAALFAGKILGWTWTDPAMGVLGSIVIARWSYGLIRDTGRVLLDAQIDVAQREEVRASIEAVDGNRVVDLHLWRVGPRHLAAILVVVTPTPRHPAHYRQLLHDHAELVHITVEVVPSEERGSARVAHG